MTWNPFRFWLIVLYIGILLGLLYAILNIKPPYININDRTRSRDAIVEDILRNGCSNKEECVEFVKRYREDKIRKSWAE